MKKQRREEGWEEKGPIYAPQRRLKFPPPHKHDAPIEENRQKGSFYWWI
jgi:hypothetical protein